jgi:hypothetical protein
LLPSTGSQAAIELTDIKAIEAFAFARPATLMSTALPLRVSTRVTATSQVSRTTLGLLNNVTAVVTDVSSRRL